MNSQTIELQKKKCETSCRNIEKKIGDECRALGEWIVAQLGSGQENPPSRNSIESMLADMDRDVLWEQVSEIRNNQFQLDKLQEQLDEMNAIRVCPKCGEIVADDELFCSACGERLVKEDVAPDGNVCPQCGKPKKKDGLFCVHCGYRFTQPKPEPAVRKCSKCGTELPKDVLFCHVCGNKLA